MKIYTKAGDDGTTRDFRGKRKRKNAGIFAALGDLDESNAAIGLALATLTTQTPGAPNDATGQHADMMGESSSFSQAYRSATFLETEAMHRLVVDIRELLRTAQSALFSCGARLAGATRDQVGSLDATTAELERTIDSLDTHLPPLRNFILPGGSTAAAQLQLARTIVRRAERTLSRLTLTTEDADLQRFINRLSDALFVAARATNAAYATPDTPWHASSKSA